MAFWNFEEVPDSWIVLLGLVGLCPVFWYIWLAMYTEEGQRQLADCIGLAVFHFMLLLVVVCYFFINRSIRKANRMKMAQDQDVEAQMEKEVQDAIRGTGFSICMRMGWD